MCVSESLCTAATYGERIHVSVAAPGKRVSPLLVRVWMESVFTNFIHSHARFFVFGRVDAARG